MHAVFRLALVQRSHHLRAYLVGVDRGVPLGVRGRRVPEQHLHGAEVARSAKGAKYDGQRGMAVFDGGG